jgi:hypothetical protein
MEAASSMRDFVQEHKAEIQFLEKYAFENQLNSNLQTKLKYDLKATELKLEVGDQVFIENFRHRRGEMKKLSKRFTGPYLVLKVLNNGCVRLLDQNTSRLVRSPIHKDKLRVFYSTPQEFQRRNQHDRNKELPWKDGGEGEQFDPTPQDQNTSAADMTSPQDDGQKSATQGGTQLPTPPPNTNKSEWIEIERIEKHRRTGKGILYMARFKDGSTQWLKSKDLTQYAIDCYWIRRKEQGLKRYKRRTN